MPAPEAPAGTPVEGSVALVTGGQRGLGRAVVEELLARGAGKVYATARDPRPEHDPRIVPLALEVTDEDSTASVVRQAGDVSILVNNAGVSRRTSILTSPMEDIRAEFETNVFGLLHVARAFAPVLAENSPGVMLNVLSVRSWLATGKGYDATKAAGWSITNSLRDGLRDQGTNVIGFYVAYIDTAMTTGFDVPKLSPGQVARQAVEAIAAGASEVLADDETREVRAKLSEPITG